MEDFIENWWYKLLYGSLLPVTLKVLFPCVIIFLLDVVIRLKDDQMGKADEMYDFNYTDRMIRWMGTVHIFLELPKIHLYCYYYEEGQVTFTSSELALTLTSLFSAISMRTFVAIYLFFEVQRQWYAQTIHQ